MAELRRLSNGRSYPLPARVLVGRAEGSPLPADNAYASSEHARIAWSGERWEVRDLGSKNGTYVDGERLAVGQPGWLVVGAKLGFGSPEAGWEVIDDAPPEAMATRLDGQGVRVAERDMLALPSDDDPQVTLFMDPGGTWFVETEEGGQRLARDQQVVTVDGTAWRLDLPVSVDATPHLELSLSLDQVVLELNVSQDEERAQLGLRLHGVTTLLEPREHAYLLLLLARARLEDTDRPPDQRGWRSIEDLRRMLKVEPNAINVLIHRARQQLAEAGLEGAARVVEVRRGIRRLATERFEIGRLED